MESSLLATAINCTIQDLKDRQFISGFKKQLELLPDKEREDKNIKEAINFLADVINRDMTEKQECLYELFSRDFTDDLKSLFDDDTNYSKAFKRDFLTKLSANRSITTLKPFSERLQSLIDEVELNNGKRATNALYSLYDTIEELQKTAYKVKTSSTSGNIVIIDPISNSTHNTMGPVLEELKQAVSNKIKTINVIDNMVGGGFAPKTFNIFGAIGGNGKSLTLQNILLYASKNNNTTLFDLDPGLSPCLLFISLELTKKQCFQRQLAWCGIRVTDEELMKMSEEQMSNMAMEWSQKVGLKLPIVYIERIQGQFSTSITEIDSECTNLVNMGFQPVMIAIDYLDRLEVSSVKHRSLNMVGGEGSVLLRQKGAECRELSIKRNCPVISAAQLNGEAQSELTKVEGHLRQIDIVHHFGTGMLAGSKQLQTELDTIIFQHKISIENKSQESESIETTEFIAMSVMKDRDGHSVYKLSPRDRINEADYRRQTQKVRNNLSISELLKDTPRIHAVIPLHSFRLDEEDYARSIRMYYGMDNAEFVSLTDIMNQYDGSGGSVVEDRDITVNTGDYCDDVDAQQERMNALAGIGG